MRYLFLILSLSVTLFSQEHVEKKEYSVSEVPKNISVKEKKERYFALLLPPIQKVHKTLWVRYESVKEKLKDENSTEDILALKKVYNVTTDRELLVALKPHPISITLAQGAMESAWGTSRFFREANNVFGMWNRNKNAKRIAAGVKRGGKHTIWLSCYEDLQASISAYYRTLQKGKSYRAFRELNYTSDDVYSIVTKLDKYSERGEAYTKELASMIRYNKLTKYD